MDNVITITIPDEARDAVQKADIEQASRRNIITYILGHDDIQVSESLFAKYQEEYDQKLLAFENAKRQLEENYILPAVDNKKNTWALDYNTCKIKIQIIE